jgi:hypothetical protein
MCKVTDPNRVCDQYSMTAKPKRAKAGARGLEPQKPPVEDTGPKPESASEKTASPPPAPQGAGTLGLEMAEIVSAWPKLPPEIRVAVLTLLRAAKNG